MLTQDDKQRLLTASAHYEAGEYSEALIILNDLLLAHPTNSNLFFEIAKNYQKINQTKLAMANFDRAIKNASVGQPYTFRKAFAAQLAADGHFRNANIAYLPILNEPQNEKDLVIGIEYLLHNDDFKTAERTILEYAVEYPNILDVVCANPLNNPKAIDFIKGRKNDILRVLKKDFTPSLEKHTTALNDFIKNTQEEALDHLVIEWYKANENFQEVNNIPSLIAVQKNIISLGERFDTENQKLQTEQKENILQKIRTKHLAQLQSLKNVEIQLQDILLELPATSLKTQIPTFLQNSKKVQEQTQSDNVIIARKAYMQLDDLIAEGQSFLHQGRDAIATVTAMEAPTEKSVATINTKVSKERREYRQRDPDNVVILDSQLNKRGRSINRWLILLVALVIVGGGVATYLIHFAEDDDNQRILLTNVFMRRQAVMDSEKVNEESYKESERLKLLDNYGDWLRLEASDGNIGYMRAEYLVKPSENAFLKGIYGTAFTQALFESARHKLAIFSYFKQNDWTCNVSKSVEEKVFGYSSPERQIYQVFGNIPEDKLNIVKINKWTNNPEYTKKDMAVIVRGRENEQLIFFGFRDDNTFSIITDVVLEGIGHQLEFIDYKKSSQSWCFTNGQPLNSNAILVHTPIGNQDLYVYDAEIDDMVKQSQDFCN